MPSLIYAITRYLAAVAQDGDYLNDWLGHLPAQLAAPLAAWGQYLAAVIGA